MTYKTVKIGCNFSWKEREKISISTQLEFEVCKVIVARLQLHWNIKTNHTLDEALCGMLGVTLLIEIYDFINTLKEYRNRFLRLHFLQNNKRNTEFEIEPKIS